MAMTAAALGGCAEEEPEQAALPVFGHPPPTPPSCPPQARNCAVATGSVLTLERIDPDGDGDAHLILASPQGITAPGISVIDVKRSLRPRPLPASGDRVAAVGPVYRGSYGQRQIQATELRIVRR